MNKFRIHGGLGDLLQLRYLNARCISFMGIKRR